MVVVSQRLKEPGRKKIGQGEHQNKEYIPCGWKGGQKEKNLKGKKKGLKSPRRGIGNKNRQEKTKKKTTKTEYAANCPRKKKEEWNESQEWN